MYFISRISFLALPILLAACGSSSNQNAAFQAAALNNANLAQANQAALVNGQIATLNNQTQLAAQNCLNNGTGTQPCPCPNLQATIQPVVIQPCTSMRVLTPCPYSRPQPCPYSSSNSRNHKTHEIVYSSLYTIHYTTVGEKDVDYTAAVSGPDQITIHVNELGYLKPSDFPLLKPQDFELVIDAKKHPELYAEVLRLLEGNAPVADGPYLSPNSNHVDFMPAAGAGDTFRYNQPAFLTAADSGIFSDLYRFIKDSIEKRQKEAEREAQKNNVPPPPVNLPAPVIVPPANGGAKVTTPKSLDQINSVISKKPNTDILREANDQSQKLSQLNVLPTDNTQVDESAVQKIADYAVTVRSIFFDSNEDTFKSTGNGSQPVEVAKLAELAVVFSDYLPYIKEVDVYGHADKEGSEDFNKDLSLRRAKRVAFAMTSQSIYQNIEMDLGLKPLDIGLFKTWGVGEPLVSSCGTSEQCPQDRFVTIYLTLANPLPGIAETDQNAQHTRILNDISTKVNRFWPERESSIVNMSGGKKTIKKLVSNAGHRKTAPRPVAKKNKK